MSCVVMKAADCKLQHMLVHGDAVCHRAPHVLWPGYLLFWLRVGGISAIRNRSKNKHVCVLHRQSTLKVCSKITINRTDHMIAV